MMKSNVGSLDVAFFECYNRLDKGENICHIAQI
jgi:hypothetical protein